MGYNVADELDDADINANDRDIRAEEEALPGRLINPPGLDYACFSDKPGHTALRMLLLGTAGTGKTATVRASIGEIRYQLGNFNAVLMTTHTGVAASNMAAGAKP